MSPAEKDSFVALLKKCSDDELEGIHVLLKAIVTQRQQIDAALGVLLIQPSLVKRTT